MNQLTIQALILNAHIAFRSYYLGMN